VRKPERLPETTRCHGITYVSVDFHIPERIIMKRSIISLLIAGLFAGTATLALADDVKTDADKASTSKSRAGDTNQKEEMNQDQTMHEKGDAAFKKADKDNDGTLDRKEAKKMPRVSRNFAAIDTDKDGTVSLEEVHTYMAAHPRKKDM
jgi:chromatin remodeling complex protein RSC6